MTRHIDALRRNDQARAELLAARQEAERLRQENDALRQSLAAATSKAEIEALAQKRREVLTGQDVNSLLAQARAALFGFNETGTAGSSSAAGRARARSLIEEALALDAANPAAHRSMGVLLHEEGDPEGAIAEFRTALRLKPDDAVAHSNLGLALKQKGDLEGAIAEYRTALRLKPDLAFAHSNLGVALADRGDLEGAIAEYRTALRLKPDHAFAHFNLGLVLKATGRRVEAAREFREYLRLAPDTPANRPRIENARAALRELE